MDIYKKLAEKLDSLPEGFPPTITGVELQILAKLFTEEEAGIACGLTENFQTISDISLTLNIDSKVIKKNLRQLGKKQLIAWEMNLGSIRYKLEPFVVGFYEGQRETIDYELAHLVEHYFQEGGTEGIMKFSPALHRVIPVHGSVEKETILPYEDIIKHIDKGKTFIVYDCVCRKQQELIDERSCDFPINVCMAILEKEIPGLPNTITEKDAKALIDNCEEEGLVHTVRNVINGVNYICNCCGCCCGILRGIIEHGIENSVAKSNYYAIVKEDLCSACGICESRCQMKAISIENYSVIDLNKCIGCGLCVTRCPEDAMTMILKNEWNRIVPPKDKNEWDKQRLKNRHMAI